MRCWPTLEKAESIKVSVILSRRPEPSAAEKGRRPDLLCARQNGHRAPFSHGWAG